MTTFYAVHNDQAQAWVAARKDAGERPMLVWLANDRTWRRNTFLEEEFYALDRDMRFEEISPATAATQIRDWPPLNATTAGWILRSLQAETPVTSDELGVPRAHAKRPTLDLAVQLREARGEWIAVKVYVHGESAGVHGARVLTSDIKRGKRVGLRALGPVDARYRTTSDGILVEARLKPADSSEAIGA